MKADILKKQLSNLIKVPDIIISYDGDRVIEYDYDSNQFKTENYPTSHTMHDLTVYELMITYKQNDINQHCKLYEYYGYSKDSIEKDKIDILFTEEKPNPPLKVKIEDCTVVKTENTLSSIVDKFLELMKNNLHCLFKEQVISHVGIVTDKNSKQNVIIITAKSESYMIDNVQEIVDNAFVLVTKPFGDFL